MALLNPYRDASPFGRCSIDGIPLAGVIQSIDGAEKPEDWTFQKGTSGNNAFSKWNGTKLAESIKIVIGLFTLEQWEQHEVVRAKLRPKPGTQPPSLPIDNPTINAAPVVKIACRNVPPSKWIAAANYWVATIEVCEFNPPTPTKPGKGAPPKTKGEKQLEALLDEAAKL